MGQKSEKILWKGRILFHSRFEFKNGELGEKFIIVLNEPATSNEPYLICRVTSKEKGKPRIFGCHPEHSLFFLPAGHDFFLKDTWIQLHEIFPSDPTSFLQDYFKGELKVMGELETLTLQQLMNCIKRIRDIERIYKKMILQR